jgi:hypothetical protein
LSFAARVSIAPLLRDSKSSYFSPNFIARVVVPVDFPSGSALPLEAGLYRARVTVAPRFLLTWSEKRDDNFIALKPLTNRGQRISASSLESLREQHRASCLALAPLPGSDECSGQGRRLVASAETCLCKGVKRARRSILLREPMGVCDER